MKDYFEETVRSISELIRIDSSRQPRTQNAPFGVGARLCLDRFLSLAESLGFETENYDNYVGEVRFGKGAESIAVLAHLDVVPAGGGWTKKPFGGTVEDGKIWGRGAVDDKGPAVCCLYAMKSLLDAGFVPEKTVKLIVGCNEEDGWGCIAHYEEVAEMPETGFSPDGDFPVIYAEKGILHVRLHFRGDTFPFLSLEGGKSANMVCDFCEATPKVLDAARAKSLGLTVEGEKLVSVGKSAHGSTPEKGVNALYPLLSYFEAESPAVKHAVDCVFRDRFGLKELRDETGPLTLSPDVAEFRGKDLRIVCDIRYPATVPLRAVHEKLAQFGVKYETLHHQAPLMNDKDGPLVRTLLDVFEECTGKRAEPVAIGGGTYARALKCGAAFGPAFEDDEPVMHRADEYITLDRVKLLLRIYEKAIARLAGPTV